ncbi:hypothetical protein XPN_0261, partial [Xanthomonas arboricola pv. pruni MAFF 301427]
KRHRAADRRSAKLLRGRGLLVAAGAVAHPAAPGRARPPRGDRPVRTCHAVCAGAASGWIGQRRPCHRTLAGAGSADPAGAAQGACATSTGRRV